MGRRGRESKILCFFPRYNVKQTSYFLTMSNIIMLTLLQFWGQDVCPGSSKSQCLPPITNIDEGDLFNVFALGKKKQIKISSDAQIHSLGLDMRFKFKKRPQGTYNYAVLIQVKLSLSPLSWFHYLLKGGVTSCHDYVKYLFQREAILQELGTRIFILQMWDFKGHSNLLFSFPLV